MVIDSSALVAILCNEPEAVDLEAAIDRDPVRLISAATLVETSIVIETLFGEAAGRELDLLLHKARVEIVAVDTEQAELARDAYRRYGKGRHSAALNYGDCFSYALSAARGEALLYKGNDFGQTDLKSALQTAAD